MSLYPQGSLGLGTLSWRGHASLQASFTSYQKRGFFKLFDQCMVFLPDPDEHVLSVARAFPASIETHPENTGILDGMEQIARRLKTDYIFFTENDCPLIEPGKEAQRQIKKALALLQDEHVCMARMRHVKEFGEAFNTYDKYRRYFPSPDTLAAKAKRMLRPQKAKRLCGTAIYVENNPAKKFPNYIQDAGGGFYRVDTQVMPWTNQSIIINRKFFLETVLPYCKSVPLGRTANGLRTIEIELNRSRFWAKSGWTVACGPGLLTHKRVDDRGY